MADTGESKRTRRLHYFGFAFLRVIDGKLRMVMPKVHTKQGEVYEQRD